ASDAGAGIRRQPSARRPETHRRRVAVPLRVLRGVAGSEDRRRRLLRGDRRLRLPRAEPRRARYVLAGVRGTWGKVRRVRRRLERGERADLVRLERRPAAAVRAVAEDRQPQERPAAGGTRGRPERLDQAGPGPVGLEPPTRVENPPDNFEISGI